VCSYTNFKYDTSEIIYSATYIAFALVTCNTIDGYIAHIKLLKTFSKTPGFKPYADRTIEKLNAAKMALRDSGLAQK
jgi:hypothetical protein